MIEPIAFICFISSHRLGNNKIASASWAIKNRPFVDDITVFYHIYLFILVRWCGHVAYFCFLSHRRSLELFMSESAWGPRRTENNSRRMFNSNWKTIYNLFVIYAVFGGMGKFVNIRRSFELICLNALALINRGFAFALSASCAGRTIKRFKCMIKNLSVWNCSHKYSTISGRHISLICKNVTPMFRYKTRQRCLPAALISWQIARIQY